MFNNKRIEKLEHRMWDLENRLGIICRRLIAIEDYLKIEIQLNKDIAIKKRK